MIVAGDAHLGIVGAPAAQPELVSRPILEDSLVLVAPKDMGAVSLDGGDWRARLVRLPWVMRESGSGTRQALEQALVTAGIEPRDLRAVLQVHSSVAVLECVEAGLGVSVISRMAAAMAMPSILGMTISVSNRSNRSESISGTACVPVATATTS